MAMQAAVQISGVHDPLPWQERSVRCLRHLSQALQAPRQRVAASQQSLLHSASLATAADGDASTAAALRRVGMDALQLTGELLALRAAMQRLNTRLLQHNSGIAARGDPAFTANLKDQKWQVDVVVGGGGIGSPRLRKPQLFRKESTRLRLGEMPGVSGGTLVHPVAGEDNDI
ncbi:unnamed protein product [Phaeothamnion confervicola]